MTRGRFDTINENAMKDGGSNLELETDRWIESLRLVARRYRLAPSVEGVRQAAYADQSTSDQDRIRNLARQMGLSIKLFEPKDIAISAPHLPLIVKLTSGEVAVVNTISTDRQAGIWLSSERGLERPVLLDDLLAEVELIVLARPSRAVPDARVDAYIAPFREDWLSRIIFRDLGSYVHVVIASLICNVLGLAGIIFSMQVYDRVVPAQSFNTLYVLFSGVILALCFDFLMRRARMSIIDALGKQADLQMSDVVFGHALRIRNRSRPASTGSFIAQLRDIDQVRELLTSTTVAAIADLPFFFLFLVIYWWLAGWLVAIPLAAIVALILPGMFLQPRLRAHANEAMREASLRNAMLVEAIQGHEDIKSLQTEDRFQQQWNHLNAAAGDAQMKLRSIANSLSIWTQNVQTGVYAVTVFAGAPMVIEGDLTTGALVGASILGSRMLAPMGQLSQLASRLQQTRVAKQGLDQLMSMPVDHPPEESRIHCPAIQGNYRLKNARFCYGQDTPTSLVVRDLKISQGERIAVLGRNGAGKSTLLLALSGLMDAVDGEVLMNDLALTHIDPADVRRDVGLLTQNARLFFGTLRENITMGAPHACDDEIQQVLSMVGADTFIRKLPNGLEYIVQEGGLGLSSGQRQSVLLARLLIRNPLVVLLDEPTAMMDEATERHFIEQFRKWSVGRTVVIVTHRTRVLELIDRILLIENGAIALDGTKERGLQTLLGATKVATAKGV